MSAKKKAIWVFGDYRNYFKNRVTLQLLSRARELAAKLNAEVCAIVFGYWTKEWVGDALAQNPAFSGVVKEYIAHGADKVFLTDHPRLSVYSMETYVLLMERLAKKEKPDIILIGATTFGREFAPRVAKRLKTGLTADCIGLDINADGLLVQTAPSFGGNLVAEIVTPHRRPQMATVRAGTFLELPHDNSRTGKVMLVPLPKDLPEDQVRLLRSERCPQQGRKLEEARVVLCGGRGMGSRKNFQKLFELAELLSGEVGATRPVVYADWIAHEALVGQAGKHIKPQILFSFGISGAIQHTAACNDAKFVIAVNKNPNATMMKLADVAVIADANQFCAILIQELKRRIR
ncbi:MAG: electron transfer flavoprotein subunit alpha/FixB family protein [Syntrophaceae bacterium]|nr:electron transfer flavoprotein subunit alpha/FixB family protein [Syntrophaceae bacterium]